MPAPMQYSNAGGPLVAVVALVVIILICRWVFATDHRDQRTAARLARARTAGDYGLLVPVAEVRTREDAELLRGVLREAGIRGSVTPAGPRPQPAAQPGVTAAPAAAPSGDWAVLVFRADAERARSLVAS